MPSAVEPSTTTPADSEPKKPPFESWGRYPVYNADVRSVHWQDQFPRVIDGVHHGALPVGLGRSYGDVCLLKDGTLVKTTGMNRLLAFDPATGVLTAEAGITLAQILDLRSRMVGFSRSRRAPSTLRSAARSRTTFTARTTTWPAPSAAMFRSLSWCARTAHA